MSTVIPMADGYPIEAVDASTYQDYTAQNIYVPVDFAKAKATRPSLRWMILKSGEGTWDGYPLDVFIRHITDAQRVGFDTSPYHYHHMEASPQDQAAYIGKRVTGSLVGNMPFAIDFEDEDQDRFKHPATVLTNEQMLARKEIACLMHDNMRDTLDAVSQWSGKPAISYTGSYYCDWYLFIASAYGGRDLSWTKKYWWWLSTYRYREMWLPFGVPLDRVILWQYTSSPPITKQVNGFPNPGRLDMNYFIRDQSVYSLIKKGVPVVSSPAYKIDPKTSARLITVSAADARSTVLPRDLGVGAMIIKAGGSDGPNHTHYQDVAWDSRQKGATADGIPVIMNFWLDPAWYRANNVDEGMVTDRSGHPDRNSVLLRFLQCLHTNPDATWPMMQASQPSDWRPVQGVMFTQYNNLYQNADVGEVWFSLSITDIINQVKVLMETGVIPPLKIILQSSPEMFAKYQGQLATWLAYKPATANDAPARNTWLNLAYGGKTVWTLVEAVSNIPTIGECWQYVYLNINQTSYVWSYVPDGYTILFHESTQNRLYTPTYYTGTTTPPPTANWRPLTLSLATGMTDADLKAWLGTVPTNPNPDQTIEIIKLQNAVIALTTALSALTVSHNALVAWAKTVKIDAVPPFPG